MGGGRVRGGVGKRGRGGVARERRVRGISVSEVVSVPYTNSVCVEREVSCKQS